MAAIPAIIAAIRWYKLLRSRVQSDEAIEASAGEQPGEDVEERHEIAASATESRVSFLRGTHPEVHVQEA